jgi:hypothetical protein
MFCTDFSMEKYAPNIGDKVTINIPIEEYSGGQML